MKDSQKFQALLTRILDYSDKRDWKQFHTPKNMALSLSLEANEALELFQWSLDNDVMPKRKEQLPNELADVFYWLIKLSHHYDIDLVEILEQKMTENEKKYPIEQFLGNSGRYSDNSIE
jgi:NTP pyrophosphatase (non-canonical NTP hydrolase)